MATARQSARSSAGGISASISNLLATDPRCVRLVPSHNSAEGSPNSRLSVRVVDSRGNRRVDSQHGTRGPHWLVGSPGAAGARVSNEGESRPAPPAWSAADPVHC
jgi:hypothetical protein